MRSSLPDCWRKHRLKLGHASVYGDQELHIVEGHCGGHGIRVVLEVYAQVSARRLTSPVHRQVQRCGLNALGRHLAKGQERECVRLNCQSKNRGFGWLLWTGLTNPNVTLLFVVSTNGDPREKVVTCR